ncbi:replication initiator [Candidatus Frankia nodulisporulans]|uniref:replication initiator n=3 Tax=Candidatus Frankia nodulisporulans TaxID=2060052 RepID=UPI0030B85146
MWKRTVDLTYRRLAFLRDTSEADIRRTLRVSYIKVAEAQARGAIHFHAVLRLDEATPAGTWAPPPDWATAGLLAAAWRWAVRRAEQPCPHPHHPTHRPSDLPPTALARWGDQADTRTLTVDGGELTPAAVGNYLAKYVTKSVSTSGALDSRIKNVDDLTTRMIFLPAHHAAIVKTAWQLAAWSTFRPLGLGRWAHQFGFNGHWITKSRAYSTTFAVCRERRRTWARTHTATGEERVPLDAWGRAADDEQILTVTHWQYHAAGYARTGDQALADLAATLARSRREAARTSEPAAT